MSGRALVAVAAALCLSCISKAKPDDSTTKAKADAPTAKKWPWPLFTAAELGDTTGEDRDSRVQMGWNPSTYAFGLCQWECEDRNSAHELECYLGTPQATGVTYLEYSDPDKLVAAGIRKTPENEGSKRFGGITLETAFEWGDEAGVCSWTLTAKDKAGKSKELAAGGQEEFCFDEPHYHFYAAPDGKAVAVWVEHSGDHGCAANELVVFRMPPVEAKHGAR